MKAKHYPTYKPTPLPWLPKVPEHWGLKRAKFLFKTIDQRSEAGEETLLSVSEHHGVIPRSQANVTMFKAESYEGYKLCEKGDLVINSLWAWSKGLGFSEHHGIISTAYDVFRFKKPDEYYHPYFHYLLRTKFYVGEYFVRSKGVWISRLQLSAWSFLGIPIVLPPLPEQRQIAAFLDHKCGLIDTCIQKKTRLIELLKEQKQALINKAVTRGLDDQVRLKPSGIEWLGEVPGHWEVKKLKNLTFLIQTGPFGSQLHSSDYIENGIPVINPSNIGESGITPDNKCCISIEKATELSRHFLQTGDIVFGRRGEMGRCALITGREKGWLCGTGSIKVSLRPDSINPAYAVVFLQSQFIKDWLKLESVGATMDNLNGSILSNIPIPVPSPEEQVKILKFIESESDRVHFTITRIQREIELMQEYKTTLIAEAVTGRIDVREWQPRSSQQTLTAHATY